MSGLLLEPTPNREAAAFIKGKPVVSQKVFAKLKPELKARAFTISGVESLAVLERVRDRIAKLPAGGDWDKIKAGIVKDISPFLVTGEEPDEVERQNRAAEARAELLLRIHGFQAYAAASHNELVEQSDVFTHCKYVTMEDTAVRHTHAALNGVVLPTLHPWWNTHTGPWEWGCRCTKVGITEDEVEELVKAEKRKPIEARNVLDEGRLKRLETDGTIERPQLKADGTFARNTVQRYDVRSSVEKGEDGFSWDPGSLKIDVEQLKKRYDPATWKSWERWAKRTHIDSIDASVWEWLNTPETPRGHKGSGKKGKPKDVAQFLARKGTPADVVAQLLAAEPKHPAAVAVKRWGDDAKTFKRLITGKDKESREWQEQMAAVLQATEPMPGEPTLWRGWNFGSAKERRAFLGDVLEDGVFQQERTGMSCTKDVKVAVRKKFLNEHGMIWEVRKSKTARDVEPMFKALQTKFPNEREAILPKGAALKMVSAPKRRTITVGGKKKRVWYAVFEEVVP